MITKKLIGLITSFLMLCYSLPAQNPQFPNRGCGTPVPSQQWEMQFQQLIQQYIQQNPDLIDNITGKTINNNNQIQANYTIPVIIHVIHGGQAVGTYPNLANGQLVSQMQVLNDDFSGNGWNTSNYPANAFVNYASSLPAANKDGNGRVQIANTGIQFCLATKDTLGNILPEPGIDRVNYNSLPALTGTFTSKNPAASVYNNPSKFMAFIDGYIKKNTIWNVSKYLNIWVTDEYSTVGLLGYATFPYLSGLTGIPAGSTGSSTTDGFWCWAKAFGSYNIYPSGTYDPTYRYGRTCTHEIGHWLGLRHIWGDGTCATDYCNDTPPAQTSNYGCPTYPYKAGSCTGNSPNGEMFMNFMDYTDDPCMYMFTVDQTTRIQTAMANSPYRKFLGTHGLCNTAAPTLTVSFNSPSAACAGAAVTMTNNSTGSPTPTYTWVVTPTAGVTYAPNQNATNPSVTFANGGTYTITLTASNGTIGTTSNTIFISQISSTAITSSVTCNGGSNGSATVNVSGGTPAYSYTWLPSGGNSSSASGLSAGVYTVNIKDANNCTATKTVNITQPSAITSTINSNNVTCNGGSNGSATVNVSGGTPAYSYTWLPSGGNSSSASGLSAGVYTVNIKDANNCTATKTVNITQPAAITSTINSNNVTCNGGSNGSATVNVSGGTPAYSYTWLPSGGNSSSASGLSAGVYTVNIKDANNCTATKTVNITQPAAITSTINSNNVTCNGGSNGSATVNVSGGTPAYSYTWLPSGGNSSSASGLSAGVYTVNIKDANNCTATKTVNITQPSPITSTINSNNVTCNGGSNGSATVNVSGGTPAYSYTWLPSGGNSSSASGLSAGVYTVNIKDANNCTATKTVNITQPSAITSTINSNNVTCNGGSNGSATVNVSGGTPAYSYTWLPSGGNSSAASGLSAGVYTVNIKDANNCTATKTVNITQPSAITSTINSNNVTCNGGSNGSATVNVSGGTPAYSYTWLPSGGNSSAASGLSAGVYTVNIKDANNCTATKTVNITQPSAITSTINSNNVTCNGGSNGSATVNVSGGTPAYSYTWLPSGGNSSSASGLSAGVYTVNIKDANNCTATKTANITQPSPITSTINSNNVTCNGGSNGSATVNVSGGTPAYSYTWLPSGGNSSAASGLSAGVYTVNIKDANNCTATKTVNITQPSAITSTINSNNVTCNGGSNGSATVNVSGGTPAYSYTWLPSGGNSSSASGLSAGVYTVNIKDANNCTATKTVNITQPAPINTSVSINGGTLTALQSGANYQWVDCNNAFAAISGATSQSYAVPGNGSYAVVINVSGCIDTSACYVITSVMHLSNINTIEVFPNPADKIVVIKGVTQGQIEMYDASGKLVLKQSIQENDEISVDNFAEGLYILKITSNGLTVHKKFIIKK